VFRKAVVTESKARRPEQVKANSLPTPRSWISITEEASRSVQTRQIERQGQTPTSTSSSIRDVEKQLDVRPPIGRINQNRPRRSKDRRTKHGLDLPLLYELIALALQTD